MSQNSDLIIQEIATNQILPNPNQPRKHFDRKALEDLADSIKNYGLISPIQVRKLKNDKYELVSGERRLRACQIAQLDKIPSIIVEVTDNDSAILAIMENIQREDLSYFEEARSFQQLIKFYNMTQEEIANSLGKSQSFIANKIRLLKLPDSIMELLEENNLSERHARALLRLPDEELQKEVIEEINKKDLTVRRTEELIERIRNTKLTNNYEETITKDKKARVKSFINAQIYINTIKRAFKEVKESRNDVEYKEVDKDDCVEIKIRIPK